MPTEKHTSETVWTWTINELCRKVEMAVPQVTFGWYQSPTTGVSLATVTLR